MAESSSSWPEPEPQKTIKNEFLKQNDHAVSWRIDVDGA